jgi:hypothetical protein
MVVGTVRGTDAGAVRTRAVALAQGKLEELRSLPFADLVDPAKHIVPGGDTPTAGYSRTWDFAQTPVLAGDSGDLQRILVRVSWNLSGRGLGEVKLMTSRARY